MIRLAALIVALVLAPQALAHSRGASYSEWTLTAGGAEARARVSPLELTRLGLHPGETPEYARRAGAVLGRSLTMTADGAPCDAGAVAVRSGADGWLRASWSLDCPPGTREIHSTLLADVAPGHLHFARAQLPDGAIRQRVLTAADPVLELPPEAPGSFGRYVVLGVEHILSGWDHLAFVLALVLLAASLKELVLVATGFTLAHSLTLACAVLGLVQVRAHLVEALIGFTIALAAVEYHWTRARHARWMPLALIALLAVAAVRVPIVLVAGLALFTACYFALRERSPRLRIAMALLFGLVHGFGFAGALLEMQLPREQLAIGLLGFNVGVELGQLLVIAVLWPLLALLARRPPLRAWTGDALAACVCGLGVYWFVVRSLA